MKSIIHIYDAKSYELILRYFCNGGHLLKKKKMMTALSESPVTQSNTSDLSFYLIISGVEYIK